MDFAFFENNWILFLHLPANGLSRDGPTGSVLRLSLETWKRQRYLRFGVRLTLRDHTSDQGTNSVLENYGLSQRE
jgi:hypothetical protein